MSPRFAPDDIDEVRERADIVELVGEHVRLRKAGRSYKGLCPFHQEKTPSFTVDPDKKVYFCLAGETGVITADGVRAIGDLAGSVERVLTLGGSWVEAPFYSFGDQSLMRLTLGRNGIEKVLYATPEHRWLVRRGERKGRGREVVTKMLKPGHRLKAAFSRSPASHGMKRPLVPSPFGIARGITFGDGSRLYKGSVAYLYGEKDAELLKWFPLNDLYRNERVTVTDLPAYFKDALPSLDESPSDLYGWLAGYFAADGHVTEDAYVRLFSSDRKSLEFVRALCARIGVGTFGIREYTRRGSFRDLHGKVAVYEGPMFYMTLMSGDLTPEFFLLSAHRRRFESYRKRFERRHWVVKEVEPTDRRDEVFCAVVDETHSFALEDNILTGNCHGCGQGGSVFTFIEQIEGLSFPEAVESLARRYGVQLREVSGSRKAPSRRSRLLEAHEVAVERYQELLASDEGEPVRGYLDSRGMGSDLAKTYGVGFGGWRRDTLVRAMVRRGFNHEELMSAGLATRDGRGLRDTFYGRVLFPIFDPSGRAVAFGGRVLPPEHRTEEAPDGPKYLNSRESPIFRKSKVLYGTNWARAAVVQSRRLVLVEGYTDVIALQAAGIAEAVATCGTSLTEDHMKEISSRFGDVRVIMCLDADVAGRQAMSRERTEELAGAYSAGDEVRGSGWLPVGRGWLPEVHVANLPQGKDPADFVRAEGAEGVARVLDESVPLVEFLLRRALEGADLRTPDGRTRAIRRGIDVLRQVGDPLLRHEYALSLSDRVGVDPYEVMRALEQAGGDATRRRGRPGTGPAAPVKLTGHHRVEFEALRALFAFPVLFDDPQLGPREDDFTLPLHRSTFRLAGAEHKETGSLDAGRLASRVGDDELRRLVSELSVGEAPEDRVARDTLVRLKVFALERYIVERKDRLRGLDPDRDSAAYDALFEELLGLEKEKRNLLASD